VILVTGGLGMIGAHTAGALADLGNEVVVTARRRPACSMRWTPPRPGASAGSPSPAALAYTSAGPRPAGTRSSRLRHDTYNVSGGRPATNREFADALRPAFDVATAVADYVAWRAGHPR
jgi:nucleoside-diphosphate-sugar epimerase